MKFPEMFMACVVGMALQGSAVAQIYESKDAQGNPVFSDEPTAAGAKEVDLQETNVASPPPDIPEPPPGEAADRPAVAKGHPVDQPVTDEEDGYYYVGDNDEETERRRQELEDRPKISDGEGPGPGGEHATPHREGAPIHRAVHHGKR